MRGVVVLVTTLEYDDEEVRGVVGDTGHPMDRVRPNVKALGRIANPT